MDIAYKNEFARLEAGQEAKAFMSKMEAETAMIKAVKTFTVTPYTCKEDLVKVLKSQISTNPNQAKKALLKVYENQTKDEQLTHSVKIYNNVGFCGTDADFLSSLAEQLKTRGCLSDKQVTYLQKIMPKYARQLIEGSLAEGKIVKQGKFFCYVK